MSSMDITVLLSSGETDEWENADASMEMDLAGALIVREESDNEDGRIVALYAPGMWMKLEVNHDAD